MADYELVHEILNACPNNQMRDVFIKNISTDSPEGYIRAAVRGENVQIQREDLSDGSILFHVTASGLVQRFTFTPDD